MKTFDLRDSGLGERSTPRDRHVFEIFVILLVLGMTVLFHLLGPYRLVALHLFFLPIVLMGYFRGRTAAGVLALFCALCVTGATLLVPARFAAFDSPLLMGLALTLWAAVLGLVALLMGTLCDERARAMNELHQAYVGVVEVLSKYLQSANPRAKARSIRVAELSQAVAQEMRMSRKEIDDVRVAALLYDLESLEITTQTVTKAVDALGANPGEQSRYTFLGTDLVQSLGSVLEGALPLLAVQDDAVRECLGEPGAADSQAVPLGARIISLVREYDDLLYGGSQTMQRTPQEVLDTLQQARRRGAGDLLAALRRALDRMARPSPREPVPA